MKKTPLFLMAAGALALASCSNDEPVSVRQEGNEAISFRSGIGTRASETTNANLDKIYVTALFDSYLKGKNMNADSTVYFKDIEFAKGSDSFFTSTNGQQYRWVGNKEQLDFTSYAPSQDALGADITMDEKGMLTLENYSVPEDIADQVDFITASATGTRAANKDTGVELTFRHRLSQIELRAKSENTSLIYKVAGARIGRAEYIGTYNFSDSTWTLDDWHDTAVYTSSCDEVTLSATPQSIMGASGNAMLLPQTLTPWSPTNDPDNVAREAYLSVLVNISTPEGTQIYPFPGDTKKDENGNPRKYAWASIPLSGTWEQGKKYIYTLDFTNGAGNVDPDDPKPGEPVLGEPIKIKVNVLDWEEADSPLPMTPDLSK